VLRHLHHQCVQLQHIDTAAVAAITSIIQDEQQHHDQSLAHIPVPGLGSRILARAVSGSTEAVIWLGMRL
jgi:ubiquinone biosynthesis monooxygenase Coq7